MGNPPQNKLASHLPVCEDAMHMVNCMQINNDPPAFVVGFQCVFCWLVSLTKICCYFLFRIFYFPFQLAKCFTVDMCVVLSWFSQGPLHPVTKLPVNPLSRLEKLRAQSYPALQHSLILRGLCGCLSPPPQQNATHALLAHTSWNVK